MTLTDRNRALISLTGVDVQVANKDILQKIDLQITQSEILTVIGPNGSGKTTLIRVALGLHKPTKGKVWRATGLRVGYVPQHFKPDPTLPISVSQFLKLGRDTRSSEINQTLSRCGVAQLSDKTLSEISGGEVRRVLLARAILNKPDCLALDEPTAGVDLGGQAEFYQLIRELREQYGCAVLLVSHDLHLVMASTDRVICLNRHICCSGHPETVSEHPEYLNLFGNEITRAHAIYTHHHDHNHKLSGEPMRTSSKDDG